MRTWASNPFSLRLLINRVVYDKHAVYQINDKTVSYPVLNRHPRTRGLAVLSLITVSFVIIRHSPVLITVSFVINLRAKTRPETKPCLRQLAVLSLISGFVNKCRKWVPGP